MNVIAKRVLLITKNGLEYDFTSVTAITYHEDTIQIDGGSRDRDKLNIFKIKTVRLMITEFY